MEDKTKPTNEEVINYRGVKAMPFIIGNEAFEKLGAIGCLANLILYLTLVFNMKNVTAATFLSIFNGATNVAPLLGAFLCDTYFGRYKTLAFASICSLLGLSVLTLTAAIPNLHPPKCSPNDMGGCVQPTGWQMAFLLIGFGFLVIGAGGIRPCNLAFGADQFNPATEAGKRGINSFFNWYYFTFTFAMMVSVTVIVYVQTHISWAIGLGIPASLMFLSCVLYFLGSKLYVKLKPEGSPITSVVKVIVAATKKRSLKLPDNPALSLYNHMPIKSINTRLPYTDQLRCLNKSAIITNEDQFDSDGLPDDRWRLCSIQQVEEAKCVIKVMPLWPSNIIYFIGVCLQYSYFILQAEQADRRLGSNGFEIPSASFVAFSMLGLTMWIPIYDRLLVPALRKLTGREGGITPLQRIGIGIVFSILTMMVAGLVEEHRRNLALTRPTLGIAPKGGKISSMSGFWLVPQLILTGLTEAFNSIGQIEFYYKQFPENMRSVAGSFFFLGLAGSSFASGLLISVVHKITKSQGQDWLSEDLNQGKLDYFYYMIAALGFLNMGYFLVFAKWYKYKGANEEPSNYELVMAANDSHHQKHLEAKGQRTIHP